MFTTLTYYLPSVATDDWVLFWARRARSVRLSVSPSNWFNFVQDENVLQRSLDYPITFYLERSKVKLKDDKIAKMLTSFFGRNSSANGPIYIG